MLCFLTNVFSVIYLKCIILLIFFFKKIMLISKNSNPRRGKEKVTSAKEKWSLSLGTTFPRREPQVQNNFICRLLTKTASQAGC
jgi:hypothetical protein